MASKSSFVADDRLTHYLASVAETEHPALAGLRHSIAASDHGGMQSAPDQMALIVMLIKLSRAKDVLEIGCFKGYGSLAMALASPHVHVTTLDVNAAWAAEGREYWRRSGVERRIHFIEGLALESLDQLQHSGANFDFIYIDADKKNYPQYLDKALGLIREGGLIALDNMIWGGAVADLEDRSRQALALRATADRIRDDKRLTSCFVPMCDGLMLARMEEG